MLLNLIHSLKKPIEELEAEEAEIEIVKSEDVEEKLDVINYNKSEEGEDDDGKTEEKNSDSSSKQQRDDKSRNANINCEKIKGNLNYFLLIFPGIHLRIYLFPLMLYCLGQIIFIWYCCSSLSVLCLHIIFE